MSTDPTPFDNLTSAMPTTIVGPDFDGNLHNLRVERVTECMPVITTDHALIHEGVAYSLSGVVTVTTTWALSITVPVNAYVHFKPVGIAASGGPVTV